MYMYVMGIHLISLCPKHLCVHLCTKHGPAISTRLFVSLCGLDLLSKLLLQTASCGVLGSRGVGRVQASRKVDGLAVWIGPRSRGKGNIGEGGIRIHLKDVHMRSFHTTCIHCITLYMVCCSYACTPVPVCIYMYMYLNTRQLQYYTWMTYIHTLILYMYTCVTYTCTIQTEAYVHVYIVHVPRVL